MKAHSTAFVHPEADVAPDVEVGPFSWVGSGVRLGEGCRLLARVSVGGRTRIGRRNVFHPNASIGGDPPEGRIEIGDDNLFREAVTVYLPAEPGGVTRLGSRNRLHFAAHVGPDSTIGNDAVLGTYATLSGHNVVHDRAWIEGSGGADPFVTVGRMSWVRSHTRTREDVPPFMSVEGIAAKVLGVNPRCRSEALDRAFATIWRSGLLREEALRRLETDPSVEVAELVAFLRRSAAGRMGRAREGGRG
jgi:UDP-N-acetylglucosamine acyltransferase